MSLACTQKFGLKGAGVLDDLHGICHGFFWLFFSNISINQWICMQLVSSPALLSLVPQ